MSRAFEKNVIRVLLWGMLRHNEKQKATLYSYLHVRYAIESLSIMFPSAAFALYS